MLKQIFELLKLLELNQILLRIPVVPSLAKYLEKTNSSANFVDDNTHSPAVHFGILLIELSFSPCMCVKLFWCCIIQCDPVAIQSVAVLSVDVGGRIKVHNFETELVYHYIIWVQIAMHYSFLVENANPSNHLVNKVLP